MAEVKATRAANAPTILDGGKMDVDAFFSKGFEEKGGEITKLEVGQAVQGKYIGKSHYESVDLKTGAVKLVQIYEIQTATGVARLGGVARLDTAFAVIEPGAEVFIMRTADIKTSAKRTAHGYKILSKPK